MREERQRNRQWTLWNPILYRLPFGTLLRVNGRIYEVMDRFGGGYSNRLDLMMETKEQCFSFGRQWVDVEIVE